MRVRWGLLRTSRTPAPAHGSACRLLVTLLVAPGGALDNAKICVPETHMMVTASEGLQAQLQVRACLSPAPSSLR